MLYPTGRYSSTPEPAAVSADCREGVSSLRAPGTRAEGRAGAAACARLPRAASWRCANASMGPCQPSCMGCVSYLLVLLVSQLSNGTQVAFLRCLQCSWRI